MPDRRHGKARLGGRLRRARDGATPPHNAAAATGREPPPTWPAISWVSSAHRLTARSCRNPAPYSAHVDGIDARGFEISLTAVSALKTVT